MARGRNNIVNFILAVAIIMLFRNMVHIMSPNLEEEQLAVESAAADTKSILRQFSDSKAEVKASKFGELQLVLTIDKTQLYLDDEDKASNLKERKKPADNKIVLLHNRTIVNREKSDKNHTLLKANMKEVGKIVKDIQNPQDFGVNVVNPHPFKYLLNNPDLCGNDDVFILIYVHTAPDHHKRRAFIRRTWGKISRYSVPVRIIFVMGVTKNENTTTVQKALDFESSQYGDLIQEDFNDSYHNLTYKGIAALKWIANYCPQAGIILKTDDDIFVNMYTLIRYLHKFQKLPVEEKSAKILCAVWYAMTVMRTGKWKVTKEEWEEDTYPTYCSGSAFLLTTDVAIKLHRVSYNVPFFWVDDFYITGLLPLRAGNITHKQFLSTFVLNEDHFYEMFTGPQWYTYIFSHVHDFPKMQKVWDIITDLELGKRSVQIKGLQPGDPSLSKNDPQDPMLF